MIFKKNANVYFLFINQNYPLIFFLFFCINHLNVSARTYSIYFFANKNSSTTDAWHIITSSYDETTINLLISFYEVVNMC